MKEIKKINRKYIKKHQVKIKLNGMDKLNKQNYLKFLKKVMHFFPALRDCGVVILEAMSTDYQVQF